MKIAIIKTGGKQYIVSEKDKLKVEKLNAQEGQTIDFDQVLLTYPLHQAKHCRRVAPK
jgi:large subunit ribosomal protein L21